MEPCAYKKLSVNTHSKFWAFIMNQAFILLNISKFVWSEKNKSKFGLHTVFYSLTLIFISTWLHKHIKAFFQKNKHIAHKAFDEKKKISTSKASRPDFEI